MTFLFLKIVLGHTGYKEYNRGNGMATGGLGAFLQFSGEQEGRSNEHHNVELLSFHRHQCYKECSDLLSQFLH